MELESAGGLCIRVDNDGAIRIGFDGEDWLGRGDPGITNATEAPTTVSIDDDLGNATELTVAEGPIRRAIRVYHDRSLIVFHALATTELTDLETGAFDRPSMSWPTFTPAERDTEPPDGLTGVVFQHCEFGLPATSGADLDNFFLLPHRPPTGWPLCVQKSDGPALVLAPLDAFHEQIIGLNSSTLRLGWHGDLQGVPGGFATSFGVFGAPDIRSGLDEWGRLLTTRAGTRRPGRWADALATRPSYWTDNGAAYWYRTEPDHGLAGDAAGSITATVEDLRDQGVALGAVQLDSWFYPHTELRPFDTDDWVVPPSPMLAWEPRADVLPDGVRALWNRLGRPPLVTHIRHLAASAPITNEVPVQSDPDTGVAVPASPEGYERWLDQCVSWGVETFEHDWMVEVFHSVRWLRARPGRARAWQHGIDASARERGITLQWCMATPADFAETVSLTQVTSVRTCGDHGYIATPGQLWAWFCATNALARSLGLMPYKDVFRTDPEVAGITGAPEALLSAMSTGPVGLGDRVGRCDTDLVQATCRADGVLIKPDVPIASTTTSMTANPAFNPVLLVAECYSDHPVGRWSYVSVFHATPTDDRISGTIHLDELGESTPSGDVICWNWRSRTATSLRPGDRIDVALEPQDWAHFVLAPILNGDLAIIGDTRTFATGGDARIDVAATSPETTSIDVPSQDVTGVRVTVKGAAETVTITGWSQRPPAADGQPLRYDDSSGLWTHEVTVDPRGWSTFTVSVP